MKKKLIKYSYIVLFALLIQACAVGPNYQAPIDQNPNSFRYSNNKTDSIINLKWWDIFKDSTLDSLITIALKNNKNVLIASSRIEQARANVGFNKADYGPKVGISANGGKTTMFNNLHLDDAVQSFGASAFVNWELDFWGKYRRSTEAAKAELLATFYGKRTVEIALISEVASNYFKLIDFKTRLEISKNTLAIRDSALQIIQARFDHGYTHIIDVNQAQIQKGTAEVAIPQFERSIAFIEHNLSVLLGKNPQYIYTDNFYDSYEFPDSIPSGIPSDLLQRRPDILQAEQFYRAQNARIGVAQAMRFPSISLTGLLGLGSNELSNLVSNGLGWSAGASLLGPVFEWGKNARRVDMEREKAKQSLLSYENTVLIALMEVDNALIELSTLRDELIANKQIFEASKNASHLSRERYYQGVTSYLEVIENQRVEFTAKLAYSQNYQNLLNSYVNLYRALGGGWITPEEMQKYAQQNIEDENGSNNEINQEFDGYQGQIVDLNLTPEQEQARKEEKKAQRKLEKEQRKQARKNK